MPEPPKSLTMGLLVHPDMVLLDLVGPQTVFSLLMAKVHLVWKDRGPVTTDVGVVITPTTTFADCPEAPDVLFVPGGLKGSVACMEDAEVLDFLAARGARARFPDERLHRRPRARRRRAAQGLPRDLALVRARLPGAHGGDRRDRRVVVDRNRITGGGVTAGIEFGLTIGAALRGEEYARRVQLVIEYDPKPPFDSGSPEGAGAARVDDIRRRRAPLLTAAEQPARRAKSRLGT